jgi:lipid II:glycine glycyltransferase (peptidoglycan interpeptide bridge formation enzyme)
VGDAVASASILMHDFDTVYYHFAGSDRRYNEFCPNNLLVHEIAAWAQSRGYRRFHLGGGVSSSPADSLFVFKSGFSGETATLYTRHRVLDRPTYDYLTAVKRQHEARGGGEPADPGYFPLYRR